MPYDKITDLPESVKSNLPKGAQEIFLAAYNNAWEQYKNPSKRKSDSSREETAIKVAWSAVKNKYTKNKTSGNWEKKV